MKKVLLSIIVVMSLLMVAMPTFAADHARGRKHTRYTSTVCLVDGECQYPDNCPNGGVCVAGTASRNSTSGCGTASRCGKR